MLRQFIVSVRVIVVFTVLLGVIYPAIVTFGSQAWLSNKAFGSIVYRDGKPVGSSLVAQRFTKPEYFHPRPSAGGVSSEKGQDPWISSGSNLGPTSKALIERVQTDTAGKQLPVDRVTASGSGLDPHISIANAQSQAQRVADARGVSVETVQKLIEKNTEGRTLGIMGEPRINVLMLNLDLDKQTRQ